MEQLCLFDFSPTESKKYIKKKKQYFYKDFSDFFLNTHLCPKNFERLRIWAYLTAELDMSYYNELSIRKASRMVGISREKIKEAVRFFVSIKALVKKEDKYCIGV